MESPDRQSADPSAPVSPFPEGEVSIDFWAQGDAQIDYLTDLAQTYMADRSNVEIRVVTKDMDVLREDLVDPTHSPDTAPQLIWTVADNLGPLTSAGAIQPLDGLVELGRFERGSLSAVQLETTTWGVPTSIGNQLLLYFNRSIVGDEPPADTDALVAMASASTTDGRYGLAFNETDSLWLIPWLAGFGTEAFADDGVSPTLDTPEMQAALHFLHALKFEAAITPSEADYGIADELFVGGEAAMIISGDWELGRYSDLLGDDLGVAPLPTVTSTGLEPGPYTVSTYFMVPAEVEGDQLTVVLDFIEWSTNVENQTHMLEVLNRLPANVDVLGSTAVTADPVLAGAADGLGQAIPQPTTAGLPCVLDAMTIGLRDVLGTGNQDMAGVTRLMQSTADTCVADL